MESLYDGILISASELIKDRLYFISLRNGEQPLSSGTTRYFGIDKELRYDSFFHDFGPLNISKLYRYCRKVNRMLTLTSLKDKKIVHYTNHDSEKRVNAAYLAGSYMIIHLNYTPEHVFQLLTENATEPFARFQDASMAKCFTISLEDCLNAIYKAHKQKLFSFEDFDYLEYEHYERVENGDLNWIVPGKLIGFCGPLEPSSVAQCYSTHPPEGYFTYFRRNAVSTVVRLNQKLYDSAKFTKAGFDHKELFFNDGSTPNDKILESFLEFCENTDGAVAVHCKAGLGRTGTLIGAYLMKHYRFTAEETIAWVRICRPGSIIGQQQLWLQNKQALLWAEGDEFRAKHNISAPIVHIHGIYSHARIPKLDKIAHRKGDVVVILKKVDTMQLDDPDALEVQINEALITQGDHLNKIKSQRHLQQASVNENKNSSPSLDHSPSFKTGKVLTRQTKNSAVSSKLLAKRDGTSERRPCFRKTAVTKSSSEASTIMNNKLPVKTVKATRSLTPNKVTLRCKLETPCNKDAKVLKRGKRSLVLETEKATTCSVKLIRRTRLSGVTDNQLR